MKLNRDVIIRTLLDYQEPFLRLLDYVNTHNGTLEVPVNFYLKMYNTIICPQADLNKDANAIFHLSIESLVENGIFLRHNKKNGTIVLENIVVDMLRFIDVKRSRELTRNDFEQMRAQLEQAVDAVLRTNLDTQDYNDAMTTFYEIHNAVHSKIRENVERLQVKVDKIGVDYKAHYAGENTQSVITLLDDVTEIYHRYVLPCFEFLNETNLVEKRNFAEAVNALIEWHENQDAYMKASSIQFGKTSVASYYKDISEWERKLKQYTTELESDRRNFIAFEAAFTSLMDGITELRHGKQKGFKLTANSTIFQHFSVLDGIETQKMKYQARLQWEEGKTIRRFKEYLFHIEEKELSQQTKTPLKALPADTDIYDVRKLAIAKIVYGLSVDSITEVHEFIHDTLQQELSDYSLKDTLYGLECFIPIHEEKLRWSNANKRRLNDGVYYLDYVPILLEDVAHV